MSLGHGAWSMGLGDHFVRGALRLRENFECGSGNGDFGPIQDGRDQKSAEEQITDDGKPEDRG